MTLPKDDAAWSKQDFRRWRDDFSYLGYVVALYIQASGAQGQDAVPGLERS